MPKSNPVSLADQRAALQDQLRQLDVAEAKNDVGLLRQAAVVLEDDAIDALVERLKPLRDQIANPSRAARIDIFLQAVTATRENIALFVQEAEQLIPKDDAK